MPAHTGPTGGPPVTMRSPDDLLAATPYLLGFHPDLSLVAVAIRDRAVVLVARVDLPTPGQRPEEVAAAVLTAVVRQRPTAVALIGYGPAERVQPAVAAARAEAARQRVPVREALRVEAGRWWSYLCDDPSCCPATGTRFDPATTAVAARMTVAGRTALPDRRTLERRLAPVSGAARMAMAAATDRARRALEVRVAALPEREAAAALLADGRAALARALDRYERPAGRLDDDEAAGLTVLLGHVPVRDAAWRAIRTPHPHVRLWTDLTCRAEAGLVAAPASLLAFAAWLAGDGALAAVALDRALQADPGYSMARLLDHGLRHGLPPSIFDDWGTAGSGHASRRRAPPVGPVGGAGSRTPG